MRLGNLWRYKIKSQESLLSTIYFTILLYVVLHLGACTFIYLGFQDSFIPHTWIYAENL